MNTRIKDISPLTYKSGKLYKIALLVISICLIVACSKVAEPPQTREIEHYDESLEGLIDFFRRICGVCLITTMNDPLWDSLIVLW